MKINIHLSNKKRKFQSFHVLIFYVLIHKITLIFNVITLMFKLNNLTAKNVKGTLL